MALRTAPYETERRLRSITPATTGAPRTYEYVTVGDTVRTIAPEVLPPPSRAEFDLLAAELKTSLSRLAMNDLEILSLQRELIAETRARELRTAYPHEDADTDARFV